MRGVKTFVFLIVLTAVVIGAIALNPKQTSTINQAGETVFPGLINQLEHVDKITVTSAGQTTHLQNEQEQWTVQETARLSSQHPGHYSAPHRNSRI